MRRRNAIGRGAAHRLALTLCLVLSGAGLPSQDEPPTWAQIGRVIHKHCAGCHRPGQPAPFSLLTYDDVAKRRRLVLRLVESRRMPPWPMAPGHALVGERRLPDEELDLLRRWVDAGAPAGDPSMAPAPPVFPTEWQLGVPDAIIEFPQAFELAPAGDDVVRNFVLPWAHPSMRFVRGFELRPGDTRALHHALVRLDVTETCRKLDQQDALPGFAGATMGRSEPPDGHVLAWTPGKVARFEPEGLNWRLPSHADLVVQLHLVPTGKVEQVRPQIGLWFAEQPPASIPFSVELFSEQIDIPPGEQDWSLRDRYLLPCAVSVYGIYPHAHRLCRRMRGWATLPDGSTQNLFRIDDWVFDWQDEYRYAEPLVLPAGTELSIDYRYDNSGDNPQNPHDPPQRVTFGPSASDEMGTLSLMVVPRDPRQRPTLEVARWRHTLAKRPHDSEAKNALGAALLQAGDPRQALIELDAAIALDPACVEAHCNRGSALRVLGQVAQAVACYRQALHLDPKHVVSWQNLGVAQAMQGNDKDAIASLQQALALRPNAVEARLDLGNVYAATGQLDLACACYERVLTLRPDLPVAHANLGSALLQLGRVQQAIAQYQRALVLQDDHFHARFGLGRALLTSGQSVAAVNELERAQALRPGEPEVAAWLQRARQARGR